MVCAEVSDSLTWLGFCRIPLGERAPHPSTLMKIRTRCGSWTVAELNSHLVAVGVQAGVIDMGWLRGDTTVVPADIRYRTDSGLLTKGITRIATVVRRLRRMLADLAHLLDAVTRLIRQTGVRLAGEIPASKTRRVSLQDSDARPIPKASLATPTQFGYTGQVTDNRDGIVVDYEIEAGTAPDAPRLAPAIARAIAATGVVPDAVTADRGYGQTSLDDALADLGVQLVAILRKGQPGKSRQQVEAEDGFVELVKWRTGAEGRIPALKRQHGWGRARLRGLQAPEPGAAGASSATTRSRSPLSPTDPATT